MTRFSFLTAVLGTLTALSTVAQAAPPVYQIQPYPNSSFQTPSFPGPGIKYPAPVYQPPRNPSLRPPVIQPAPVTLGFYGDFHPGHGMHVTSVIRGSFAQQLGLEPGDVIVRVNNQKITCEHDVQDALRNTNQVRLLVEDVRTGRTRWTQRIRLDIHDHDHHHGPLYSQRVQNPVY